MSALFAHALASAQQAAAAQHYPQARLYVVATPIGNLCDIGLRALHVLDLVDCVACEDTRHTQTLLRAYGVDKPAARLIAVHQHNEAEAARQVIQRLQDGQRVAYVSDAGTPAISDPGARLVAAVQAAGLGAVPVPGASSVTAALSVAGLVAESGFVFLGFLPTRQKEREQALAELARTERAVVLLEAPHRVLALGEQLAPLGARRVTLCRELTKQFEQVQTLEAHALAAWLGADPHRVRGEFVLVLHPALADAGPAPAPRALQLLLAELPLTSAVRLCAEITGASRKALYSQALALRAAGGASEGESAEDGAASDTEAGAH